MTKQQKRITELLTQLVDTRAENSLLKRNLYGAGGELYTLKKERSELQDHVIELCKEIIVLKGEIAELRGIEMPAPESKDTIYFDAQDFLKVDHCNHHQMN